MFIQVKVDLVGLFVMVLNLIVVEFNNLSNRYISVYLGEGVLTSENTEIWIGTLLTYADATTCCSNRQIRLFEVKPCSS